MMTTNVFGSGRLEQDSNDRQLAIVITQNELRFCHSRNVLVG
jgi:hypothetical protein